LSWVTPLHVSFIESEPLNGFSIALLGMTVPLRVIPVLNHYKCIGCSLGKHPDTPMMATGSDDDSRDSVHDRCLCIAV